MSTLTSGQQQVDNTPQQIAATLNSDYPGKRINDSAYPGTDIGDQWLNYYNKEHAAHPDYSLTTIKNAFILIIGLEKLKGDLVVVAQVPGQVIAATGAAASAVPNISVTGFLGGLTSGNLWVRVAKVTIGGVILIVGLAKMANIQNSVVQQAVKVAPLL